MIENIEEIKTKANIVEVISQYIPLRKEGANFTANCPFHEERSASFKVNPQKQFYHCFGCGVGGDVFKFVQEYKHLNFEEAVLEVANIQNIFAKVGTKSFHKKPYLEVLEKANEMFLNALLNQPQLLKYLQNRGLDLEDLRLFSIGYIPKDFYKNFTTEENKLFCDLGLLVRGEFGLYAPLGERISFAMRNFAHKVVGFSARTHPYANFKNSAKYINSKESKIFHKSQTLYNLSLAKTSIAKVREVWIVEGFMDAIALYKLGFKNVVATCGTAFNTTHLSAILNFTQARLVFCFDNDNAGFQANLRALNLCLKQRIYDCEVAQLQNEAKDIGDVLKNGEELKIKRMQGFLYFCKAKLQATTHTQERDRILSEIQDFINKESAYYAKNRLIEIAAFAFGIPKDYFYQSQKVQPQKPIQSQNLAKALLKTCEAENEVLELCLNYLDNEDFGELRESFVNLQKGIIDAQMREILLDEEVLLIPYARVKDSIKSLLRKSLKVQISKEIAKQDIEKMVVLNQRLQALHA